MEDDQRQVQSGHAPDTETASQAQGNGEGPVWEYEFCAAYAVEAGKGKMGEELAACVEGDDVDVASLPASLRSHFSAGVASYAHEVQFNNDDGEQNNPVRSLVRTLAHGQVAERSEAAHTLALRLAEKTDARANPGLLVAVVGERNGSRRVALWKLPRGDVYQTRRVGGILRLVEANAFSSNDSKIFKGAAFDGTRANTSFWDGRAEDNQVKTDGIAQYWIHDFLDSQHKLTDGRFNLDVARGVRKAVEKAPDDPVRARVLAVPQVLRSMAGQQRTMREVSEMFPEEVRDDFVEEVGLPSDLMEEPHEIQQRVYESRFNTRIVKLDNGVSVRGADERFDELVEREDLEDGRTRLTVTGTVVDTNLKSR